MKRLLVFLAVLTLAPALVFGAEFYFDPVVTYEDGTPMTPEDRADIRYNIYRSDSKDGPYTLIATIDANVYILSDSQDKNKWFVATAVTATEGARSNPVRFQAPGRPTGARVVK